MPPVVQQYSRYVTITAMVIAAGGFVFFPVATDAAGIPPRTIPARVYSFDTVPLLQHLKACAGLHPEFRATRDIPVNETRARVTNVGDSGF